MRPPAGTFAIIGLCAVVALQGAANLRMTAKHNAQLVVQAEVFNAQLMALTERHNAQLKALTERHNEQLKAQAAASPEK